LSPKSYQEIFEIRGHHYNAATAMCPFAREQERNKLFELVNLHAGDIVCDVPAGGGFVAEGIARNFDNQVMVVCVEPSTNFSKAISPKFNVMNTAAHKISVPDGHFSVLLSLAGLHHSVNRDEIFAEWARVVTDGGRIAVADVAEGTDTGIFLNEFVHKYCPGGHKGYFFKQGDFTELLANTGFLEISEQLCDVPWCFENKSKMAHFCHSMFGLEDVSAAIVLAGLADYVGIEEQEDGTVQLNWQLVYANATCNN